MKTFSIALRLLLRRPGFTAMAALSLALGIGLVATQFSLVDTVLLRGLPVPDADRIEHVAWQDPQRTDAALWQPVPYRDYLAIRDRQTSFESLAAANQLGMNLSGPDRMPSNQFGAYATASLLDVFSVKPLLGRWFNAEEDKPGRPLLVVLSSALWKDEFAADPGVVGRPLNINGEPGTIIGVMPPHFTFPSAQRLWVNLRASSEGDPRARPTDRLEMFGKLKPGFAAPKARAEFDALFANLAKVWPETNKGFDKANLQTIAVAYSGPGTASLLFLMLAMTVFILVLACVNVANMLLGRASQRTRELAVRAAVGASRNRLIRQLLTEALVLAGVGALGGLLVAQEGVDLMQSYLSVQDYLPGWFEFRLDHRVVAIAVFATVAAGVLAGIVPAWKASRVDMNTALKDDSRAAAGLGLGRMGRWLVTAQIAFSTMLLIAASVLATTVYLTRQANLRYEPDRLLSGRIDVQDATQTTPEARSRFFRVVLERLRSEPGVETVAVTSRNFIYNGVPTQVAAEGMVYAHDNDRPTVWLEVVSNDYFDLVKVKPVAGRVFDTREQKPEPRSAIVNESFVRKFWPKGDPLGRRFRTNQTKEEWVTVVGVVPDLQMQSVFAPPGRDEAGFYLAEDQMGWGWLNLFVRTKGDPLQLVTPLRKAVASIDPNQPVYSIGTLTSETARAVRGFTIVGMMALVFAGITLFLGALGVYGVTSQAVSRRTREFGIRMALGSTVGQVLKLVLLQGSQQIAIGVGVGLLAGYGITRPLLALFGSDLANSPATYVAVSALIIVVALAAQWIPARRAARIDPIEALRTE